MALFDNLINRSQRQSVAPAPRAPEVPGAAPMPSVPRTSVNPPAAARAPVGRPPGPSSPPALGAAGAPLPLAGNTGASSSASATPRASTPVTGGGAPPVVPPAPAPAPAPAGSLPTPSTPTPTTAPGTPAGSSQLTGGAAGGYSVDLQHVPSASEILDLPQGVAINTPFGTIDRATGSLMLSPQGQQAYTQAVQKKRVEFGPHPFAGDPTAEPIPVTLGKPMYNPFTNKWVDRPTTWGRR